MRSLSRKTAFLCVHSCRKHCTHVDCRERQLSCASILVVSVSPLNNHIPYSASLQEPKILDSQLQPSPTHEFIWSFDLNRDKHNLFTVLCLWVTYFRRVARPEICGYFKLQIWIPNWQKSERYRVIETHAYVNTAPDEIPYPIEPTRYVLGRGTTAFQIGTRESDVKTTWWQVRRMRHFQ